MINEKVTNKELELFLREPVSNLVFMPNHAMMVQMAKEIQAYRQAFETPSAYLVTGGKMFRDRVSSMKGEALESVSTRKDGSHVEGLFRDPFFEEKKIEQI